MQSCLICSYPTLYYIFCRIRTVCNNYARVRLRIIIISIYQISGQQFSRILIGSRNLEYPWIFTVLQTERKMARRFLKVSEEEIVVLNETAFFNPCDLVNTKTTIPLRVGEERWIYIGHHYSPQLRGIVLYY